MLGILEQCCFELLALTCVRSSFMHCTHRLCIVHVHVHAHCTLKLLSWVKRWPLCSLTCSSSLPNSASLSAPSSSSVLYHTVKYMDTVCTCMYTCVHAQIYMMMYMYMYVHINSTHVHVNTHTCMYMSVSSFTISLSFSNASVLYTYFPCTCTCTRKFTLCI